MTLISTPERNLSGRTILISGGSRGIGLAIALRAAADGANVAMLAKTDTPHPALEGTIHTAAAEIEAAGGKALAVVGDVRDDASVARAVEQAVEALRWHRHRRSTTPAPSTCRRPRRWR